MKIVAAHLPAYLPGLELFCKMVQADAVILADHLQYSKHGVLNRNRIKTPEGARWLTVPVLTKGRGRQAIHAVEINNNERWAPTHWRALQTHYSKSPYFMHYADRFEQIYRTDWRRLIDLNSAVIHTLCHCLKLNTPIHLSSKFGAVTGNKNWLVDLIKRIGGTAYLASPRQRAHAVRENDFTAAGITLIDTNPPMPRYHQLYGEFIPDLSMVDLLFNEGGHYLEELHKKNDARGFAGRITNTDFLST